MRTRRPQRLNLAIARRCYVACRGCYQFFGRGEPDLEAAAQSVARFVHLGITAVTLSGGDPLTLAGLNPFLDQLRSVGMRDIKLDTVGTGLLQPCRVGWGRAVRYERLQALLKRIDYLGLPLDGASNASMQLFRTGRAALFDEIVALLTAVDACTSGQPVVINTVVHRLNLDLLPAILQEISRHRSIGHWNLFQYTPTDQASAPANRELAIGERAFTLACADLFAALARLPAERRRFSVETRTIRSRLCQYLLVNSDGEAWLPDEHGKTVPLANVFGREAAILAAWTAAVQRIHRNIDPPGEWRSGGASRALHEFAESA